MSGIVYCLNPSDPSHRIDLKIYSEREALATLDFWRRLKWRLFRHCIPFYDKGGRLVGDYWGFIGYVLDYGEGIIVECPDCHRPTPCYGKTDGLGLFMKCYWCEGWNVHNPIHLKRASEAGTVQWVS